MNLRRWVCYTAMVVFLYSLSACAPPQTNTQKGAIYGAAAGAAVGAVVGQAIGHDTKGTLEGAAIGAAVGGLAGAGIGRYMDQQEQALRQAMAASQAAMVNRQGNILSVTFKSDFFFDVDSSVVKPGAYRDIDRLAKVLNEFPNTRIRIEGHTDSTGSESYNLRLSQRRAEAIRNLLVARGVSPTRIVTIGYGESMPRASNTTFSGRQLNRRVEVYIEPIG